MFDEGQKLPSPTTAPSSSPSTSSAKSRPSRGASTGPRSSSATRRPARWTRSTGPTTSSRPSRRSRHRCRPGSRSSAPSSAARTSCRSTSSPRRWTTSPTRPASTARPSTSSTRKSPALGRGAQHLRQAAHAPQLAMRIDKRLTDALPKGVALDADAAARRSRACARAILADFGIPEEVLGHVALPAALRHPRHPARAGGHGHRGAAAGELRREALGLLGAPPRPRPLQGPLVRGRRQRPARS